MPSSNNSKHQQFINRYINEDGISEMISRYDLPQPFAYTSGDGIFRMDQSKLSTKYKYCYFKKGSDKIRYSWRVNDEEKQGIEEEYKSLTFPKDRSGNCTCFIKFYGIKEAEQVDEGIRDDIRIFITKQPCCMCFSKQEVQCDHKNDLKNDPRVLEKATQTIDDFQPLCRHCNCLKRNDKRKMLENGKRIGASKYGFSVDFISGDETLDVNDPKWYIGTYWGDVRAFKSSLR